MSLKRMIAMLLFVMLIAGSLAFFLYSDTEIFEEGLPAPMEIIRGWLPDSLPTLDSDLLPEIPLEQAWYRINELIAGLSGDDEASEYAENAND